MTAFYCLTVLTVLLSVSKNNIVELSVTMLKVLVLSVVLSVIMLRVVLLNVMAPFHKNKQAL